MICEKRLVHKKKSLDLAPSAWSMWIEVSSLFLFSVSLFLICSTPIGWNYLFSEHNNRTCYIVPSWTMTEKSSWFYPLDPRLPGTYEQFLSQNSRFEPVEGAAPSTLWSVKGSLWQIKTPWLLGLWKKNLKDAVTAGAVTKKSKFGNQIYFVVYWTFSIKLLF